MISITVETFSLIISTGEVPFLPFDSRYFDHLDMDSKVETEYLHSVMNRFRDQDTLEQFAAELDYMLDLSEFLTSLG